jgi:hypothetical protein
MNPAEQHNMITLKQNVITLKQSSEANQLTSLVLFDLRTFKVDYLSLAPHSYKFPWYSARHPVIL